MLNLNKAQDAIVSLADVLKVRVAKLVAEGMELSDAIELAVREIAPEAVEALHPLLKSGHGSVRVAAAIAILQLVPARSEPPAPAAPAPPTSTTKAAPLAPAPITGVASGNSAPLIDLTEVSEELNAAADSADLLILEGMGRSVESNFDARFAVDTAKLALLKDARVAERIGGKLFEIVCKFEPA